MIGERGQRLLDFGRPRPVLGGDRQPKQGHQSVRLDLEQGFRHSPRLPRRETPIEDEKALVPILVDPEIGEGISSAVADLRADDRAARKIAAERGDVPITAVVDPRNDHMRRRNRLPRNRR